MVGFRAHHRRWWGWFQPEHKPDGTHLSIWYDASRETDPDGTPVPSLTDYSGNGFDAFQASPSRYATLKTGVINGLSVYRFDGIQNGYAIPHAFVLGTAGIAAFTVIIPKSNGVGFTGTLVHHNTQPTETLPYPYTGVAGSYEISFYQDSGGLGHNNRTYLAATTFAGVVVPNTPPLSSQPAVINGFARSPDPTMTIPETPTIWTWAIGNANFANIVSKNGFIYTASSGAGSLWWGDFQDHGVTTGLGARSGSTDWFNGDVGEMIVFTFDNNAAPYGHPFYNTLGAVWRANQEKLIAWLAWKWGLVAQLASSVYTSHQRYGGSYPFKHYRP